MITKKTLTILLTVIILVVSMTTCKKPEPETTGNINGTIKKSSGEKIENALVKINTIPNEQTATTSADGTYSFTKLEPKTYQITVTKDGYKSGTDNVTVIAGETKMLDFALAENVISFTAPISGTKWAIGSTQNVTWTDNFNDNVKIELFKGENSILTISNSAPSTGLNAWTIPTSVIAGNDYKIRITNTVSTFYQESAVFTITDLPKIKISTPISTTNWRTGTTQTIEWTDNIDENVNIELYKNTVLQQTIITNTESDGSYTWNIPTNLIEGVDYRIKITSVLTSTLYAESDYFSISKGAFIDITPNQRVVSANGGNTTFDIKSNVTWNASSDQSWCIISNITGTGNATLTINYQKNSVLTARTAQIVISGIGVANQTVSVVQDGMIPSLVVTPANYDVPKEGGSKVFTVTANIDWQITSNQSWCTINANSGSSSGSIIATYDANTAIGTRTATLTFTGVGVSNQIVTITQAGTEPPSLTITPPNQNVTNAAGTTTFTITSNVSWTATIDQTWSTIDNASGIGNKTITVTYQANTTSSQRTATLTVTGNGVAIKTVTITQKSNLPTDGLVAYYPFNGNANDESGNGNNGTVSSSTLTTDRKGNANSAYNFDGINDYIEIPSSVSLSLSSAITISAWVQTTSISDYAGIVSKWDCRNNNAAQAYSLCISYGKIHSAMNAYDNGADNNPTGSILVSNNNWHHLTVTADNITHRMRLFVDGVLDTETQISGNIINQNNTHVLIGVLQLTCTPNFWFTGKIDDIRVYNKALSESDVLQLSKE